MYSVIKMKKDKKAFLGAVIALVGIIMMAFGIAGDEHREVFEKAVRICLECIGIG